MKTLLFLSLFLLTSYPDAACQTQHFRGSWTRIGTNYLFDFDLHLEHGAGNQVQGHFDWKFVQYDETDEFSVSYYRNKIGATAKEYVKGTWNPTTRTYHLKGYKKDDPNAIIATDEYLLKLDSDGDIGGETKSHNTWLGRINGELAISKHKKA